MLNIETMLKVVECNPDPKCCAQVFIKNIHPLPSQGGQPLVAPFRDGKTRKHVQLSHTNAALEVG